MSNVVTKSVLDALRRELRAKKTLKHVLFSLARADSLSAIKYMSQDIQQIMTKIQIEPRIYRVAC